MYEAQIATNIVVVEYNTLLFPDDRLLRKFLLQNIIYLYLQYHVWDHLVLQQ